MHNLDTQGRRDLSAAAWLAQHVRVSFYCISVWHHVECCNVLVEQLAGAACGRSFGGGVRVRSGIHPLELRHWQVAARPPGQAPYGTEPRRVVCPGHQARVVCWQQRCREVHTRQASGRRFGASPVVLVWSVPPSRLTRCLPCLLLFLCVRVLCPCSQGNTCVDLDDLYWLPGWKKRSGEEVRGMLSKLFAAGPVVVAGVYESDMGPLMRSEATTLVWVRPPYYRLMWQLCSRSLINVCLGRCNCGNGNTETIYSNFLAPNSIVRKTHRSYHRVEARYKALMLNPPPQLDIVVLTNRAEAAAFIRVMSEARTGPPMAATESMFASLARKLAGSMSQKLAEYRARKAAARHATNLAARQAKLASAMRFRQRASEKVAQLLARQAKELEEARREEEEAVRAEAEALAAQQQLDAEEALAAEEAKRNGGSITAAGDREPSTPPPASQLHQRKNAAAAAAAAASSGSDAQSTGEASMAR